MKAKIILVLIYKFLKHSLRKNLTKLHLFFQRKIHDDGLHSYFILSHGI